MCTPGMRLSLKRVRNNPYDSNAIGVFLLDAQIGWIPKSETAGLAAKLERDELMAIVSVNDPANHDLTRRLSILVYKESELFDTLGYVDSLPVKIGDVLYYNNEHSSSFAFGEAITIIGKGPQTLVTSKTTSRTNTTNLIVSPDSLSRQQPEPLNQTAQPTHPIKENFMTTPIVTDLFDANKSAAISAAFLEGGRIANKTVTAAIAKKAPIMVRGYIETPIGALVVANIAALAAEKLRPNDPKLKKLTSAMRVQAFQALYQEFDIEQMLADLMDNASIKRALDKLSADGEDTDADDKPAAKPRRSTKG